MEVEGVGGWGEKYGARARLLGPVCVCVCVCVCTHTHTDTVSLFARTST